MRPPAAVLLALLGLLLATPAGNAQSFVQECQTLCDPHDPAVNDGIPIEHGPFRQFFWAHGQDLNWIKVTTQVPFADEPQGTDSTNLPSAAADEAQTLELLLAVGQFIRDDQDEIRDMTTAGFVAPVNLTLGQTLDLVVYVQTDANIFSGAQDGGVAPEIAFRARLLGGRDGPIIAQGDTATVDAAGLRRGATLVQESGASGAFEVHIPMTVAAPQVQAGYALVEVLPYIAQGSAGDVLLQNGGIRFVTDPKTPIHLVAEVHRAYNVSLAEYERVREIDFLRFHVSSPFTGHDIDLASAHLEVTGPSAISPASIQLRQARTPYRGHGLEEPAQFTWAIAFDQADAPPGRYVAHFSALNLQGTFRVNETFEFEYPGPAAQEKLPAPELVLSILAVCAVVLSRRTTALRR